MRKTGYDRNGNADIARPGVRTVDPYSYSGYGMTGTDEQPYSGYSSYKTRVRAKRRKKLKKLAVIAAAAVIVVALAVMLAAGVFQKRYKITMADGSVVKMTRKELIADMTPDVFPEGIIINGIDVSGMTQAEALTAIQAIQPERPLEIDVTLLLDGQEYPLDLSSLPIEVNDHEVVDKAFNYLRPTGEEEIEELISMHDAREALKGTPKTYQTAYTPNTEDISTQVHAVLDPLDREAVDAVITGFDVQNCTFQYTDSQQGYAIDMDMAVADVKELLDGGTYAGTVEVNAEITTPDLTSSMIQNEFGLISSTSSSTSTSNSNRINNVATAASSINGTIIQPGGSFSFNGVVGQRTAANGYMEAGVIVEGVTEQGFGGGVCQVSTMVYESAVKADLQINERHAHQWPAKYADDGCDAAVDWGSQDLVFTNTSGYPIVISAYHDNSSKTITVAIYGHRLPDGEYITFTGSSIDTVEYQTTYVQNTELPVGQTNTTRSGHNAKTATSYKIRYASDGTEISRETYTTYYNVINEEIEVGTLQADGTQASFDPVTGSVVTTEVTTVSESEETYPEETDSYYDDTWDDTWDESDDYYDDGYYEPEE
jgi:vancomycin resistance protein YoaR